jgi:hypothetical protein
MPYKEVEIRIRIVNGKTGHQISKNYEETAENISTLIGILETIKQQELNKLETFKNPDGKQV